MKRFAGFAALIMLLAFAALAAWRVIATSMSDRLATENPAKALEWDGETPTALIALARHQLDQQEPEAARQTALKLLQSEPLAGEAYVLLGRAAQMDEDEVSAARLADIAARRAPGFVGPRALLVREQLIKGQYAEALESIDQILRISPGQHQALFPLMITFSQDPAFATALAARLGKEAVWRSRFVTSMVSKADLSTLDLVLSGLQENDDLEAAELGLWIDRLGREGRWGEAYARWASELDLASMDGLASVYNGGFETTPSGIGFDWRIGESAGVIIQREGIAGATGHYSLGLMFLGRRIENIPVHQQLLLAPGSYRFQFRARTRDFRSDRGLQWVIRCPASRTELGASERLNGTFDWSEYGMAFEVPESGCDVQNLGLSNAGSKGAGKIVLGTIWFDDLAIDRIRSPR